MMIELRKSPRDRAVPNSVRICWRGGESPARIIDISEGGALVASARTPGQGEALWLRPEEPMSTPAIPARVVRRDGDRRVGIAFDEKCPFDLHRGLALGVSFDLGLD